MPELEYEVLDVFTDTKFRGNPLAVVKLQQDLPQSTKQQIAKEFNLSETIFWHEARSDETRIDIFTPVAELPFAGHPTIGAAVCVLRAGVGKSTLLIKAGTVQIESRNGYAFATIPHNSHKHAVQVENGVVWSIVPGMTYVLIKLDSLEALAAQTDQQRMEVTDLDEGWQEGLIGTYYYVAGEEANSYQTRMFTDFDGVVIEDAATGSAACTLAAHLLHESQKARDEYHILQGVEMGRRSEILVDTRREEHKLTQVVLGGKAIPIMKGILSV